MEAYLDNSATTQAFQSVCDKVVQMMSQDYGNPSSLHRKGMEAEQHVRAAREIIAGSLRVSEKEIYFTSGGTESNNLAIVGTAMANRRAGNHIITTSIEHASVSAAMGFLEEQGFVVTYLPVDQYGIVDLRVLEQAICKDTILVSVMYVNNEIGSVQPIEAIAQVIRRKKPDVLFHVDAIQAYGKFVIRPRRQGIDLLAASGHKIHGPKGVGFLYVRDKVKIRPLLFGGGQQNGLRSGTENVPGAAGLGEAVREIYKNSELKVDYLYHLKERFTKGVLALEGTRINGPLYRNGAPHIVSVSFDGVRSEVLLHALEDQGVYASAGSACSSHHPMPSATLKGISVEKEYLDSTLRFSFGAFTKMEEIDYAVETLGRLLPVLRKYNRM